MFPPSLFTVAHPCRQNNGNCEQICIPRWSKGFAEAVCICSHGYRLHKNNTNCEFVHYDRFLVLARQRLASISGVPLQQQIIQGQNNNRHLDAMVPIYNVTWPLGLDINVRDKLIYFIQPNK